MEIKFSIITVCYNSCKKIESTLLSVISQTQPNVEYIIIDGGSTDGTMDIINKYKNQIAIIISEKDYGIYEAMNKGIEKSTGNFIAFLNAGDRYFSSDTLFSVGNYIDKYRRKTDLFFFQSLSTSEDNSVVRLIDTSDITDKFTIYKKSFSHMATFINRPIFDTYGMYNENNKIISDYEWLLKVLVKNKKAFKFINHIVSIFEIGGISTDPKFKNLHRSELDKVYQTYFTRIENLVYNSSFFKKIYKTNLLKLFMQKFFKLRLNRIYG
jgi:glycosyltransferase involved in cell wall biosynthesis